MGTCGRDREIRAASVESRGKIGRKEEVSVIRLPKELVGGSPGCRILLDHIDTLTLAELSDGTWEVYVQVDDKDAWTCRGGYPDMEKVFLAIEEQV